MATFYKYFVPLLVLGMTSCGGQDGVQLEKQVKMTYYAQQSEDAGPALIGSSNLTCDFNRVDEELAKGLVPTTCYIGPEAIKNAKIEGNKMFVRIGNWVLEVPEGKFVGERYMFDIDVPVTAIT